MSSSAWVAVAPADKLQIVPNMTQLSPSIFLYRPAPGLAAADPAAPKLVLLAAWMDARDVHIVKYISRYQVLYPTSCILLVKSSFRHYFSPSSARREIAPAVHVVRDVLDPPSSSSSPSADDSKPQMLIHVFSNGGSCMLYHLYDMYAETAAVSPKPIAQKDGSDSHHLLPTHITIFDSVPGRWSYSGSTGGVLAALPAGWVRMLAFPLVHLLGVWWVIKYLLLKVPEETHVWGFAHNDQARVRETCRAYVYSEADEFVDYRAVEEHADHAETNGYVVVHRDKFPNSQHVAHARSDPDRYWSLVRDTWNAGN